MADALVGRLGPALARAARELREDGRLFALVGGLGVGTRTEPRTTRDVDLVVATTGDPDAESVVLGFVRRGWGAITTVEHEGTGRLATARLRPPEVVVRGVFVDLLFATCGLEPEIARAAEEIQVYPDLSVPVAQTSHLLAMKILARDDVRRGQDLPDINLLIRSCDDEDLAEAREALATIEARGYNRGRSLVRELERLLAARRESARKP